MSSRRVASHSNDDYPMLDFVRVHFGGSIALTLNQNKSIWEHQVGNFVWFSWFLSPLHVTKLQILWVVTRMAFMIPRVYSASVFYCILINVLIFANDFPSSQSPRSNSLIYFPGRMRTNNSSHTRLGNSLLFPFLFLLCSSNK